MYRVRLAPAAEKQLNKISAGDQSRISTALRTLSINPRPHGVRKLRERIHRIRAGNWRIVYAIFDREGLVVVVKIARRSEDTYDDIDGLT